MTEYGGFWLRVVAYIIDAIVTSVVAGVLGMMMGAGIGVGMGSAGSTESDIVQAAEAVGNLLGLLIGWLYFAILESSPWQATLGKKALGLVVTDQLGQRIGFGRATGRYFAKILSALILLIGFIMVAFTERKQGLHDLIAGTFVVRGQPGNIDVSAFE